MTPTGKPSTEEASAGTEPARTAPAAPPPHPAPSARRGVLVSGAGVAGSALAYWLRRAGYAVTVVEKADGPRVGGYPIDVRGTAVEVVRRMGILPRLREAHIETRRLTFLGAGGGVVASLRPSAVTGGAAAQDLEVRRGDLAAILHALIRDDTELLFGDSIATLDQSGPGVDVTFRSGRQRTFDLVIGADGTHSRTRRAVFGPEERFHRHLGHCFAVFTLPNTLGLSRELVMWNDPGRAAALYAVGEDDEELHALLTFHRQPPPAAALRDPGARLDLLAETFADAGWEVPRMVAALREERSDGAGASSLFTDTAGQIRLPRWSAGRVALVGDAAYAPSFLTGQGTSLALAGAYLLADALAAQPDHTAAFTAYERGLRAFADANQALADGGATLFPATARALAERDAMLRGLAAAPRPSARPAHSALALPDPARLA